jgi:pimeloyl-ACP methyl ester carboxylesterase
VLPGVGHFAQIEAADEVNRLIADFSREAGR